MKQTLMTIGAVLLGLALVTLLMVGDSSLFTTSKEAFKQGINTFKQIP